MRFKNSRMLSKIYGWISSMTNWQVLFLTYKIIITNLIMSRPRLPRMRPRLPDTRKRSITLETALMKKEIGLLITDSNLLQLKIWLGILRGNLPLLNKIKHILKLLSKIACKGLLLMTRLLKALRLKFLPLKRRSEIWEIRLMPWDRKPCLLRSKSRG